jgi:hypothetical protein
MDGLVGTEPVVRMPGPILGGDRGRNSERGERVTHREDAAAQHGLEYIAGVFLAG